MGAGCRRQPFLVLPTGKIGCFHDAEAHTAEVTRTHPAGERETERMSVDIAQKQREQRERFATHEFEKMARMCRELGRDPADIARGETKEDLWRLARGGALADKEDGIATGNGLRRTMQLYNESRHASNWWNGSDKSFAALYDYLHGPETEEEFAAFNAPLDDGVMRVIVVRYGFGDHNKYSSTGSAFHRDAELTSTTGKQQAEAVGTHMRDAGVLEQLDLAVISPFTRTLQTAQHLLGAAIGPQSHLARTRSGIPTSQRNLQTYIQPLCAEDTMPRANVFQGNQGSTADELRAEPS